MTWLGTHGAPPRKRRVSAHIGGPLRCHYEAVRKRVWRCRAVTESEGSYVNIVSFAPGVGGASRARVVRHLGLKAILVEPLLIIGSSLLWLAVLPFAGLFFSGAVLWNRAVRA